jgi:hypothetical protein
MITKEQFLASIFHETAIIKHLHAKLTPEMLDFRPAKDIRSILEVLQYLTFCGILPAQALLKNDWSIFAASQAQAAKLTFEEIPAALDRQAQDIQTVVSDLTDEQLLNQDVLLPWGTKDKLGISLVNTSLKFLCAYRLQLFVSAKAAGLTQLNTANCWGGVDRPAAQ